MSRFEIFTDSSCDLPNEIVEQFDLHVLQLEVIIDDNPPVLNKDVDIKEFYEQLRNGANAKTSAITLGLFQEETEKVLKEGKDILYIGFSSGLSVTYNNGAMVLNELREKYPDRKIYDVDSLCASVGQGLLVYYAGELREAGESIEEVHNKIESIKQRIHHEVTVNDLFFLKRGGRIDATTAIAGSILNIKPIIDVDDEGRLNTVGKVRGRKAAIKELFAKIKATETLDELPYVFISHSDCFEDANSLATMVKNEYENVKVVINDIGPVIGAHTGPGTIALCYLGNYRRS